MSSGSGFPIALAWRPLRSAATKAPARRGSFDRPINGRLYRSSFLVLSLPLLLAAFTVNKPAALQAPVLPPAFDADVALDLDTGSATLSGPRAG